ncbi:hypothetical protein J7T55_006666 [Diaporthe amygdali]|uniref:uncharacterized protein n=1 Tax=Phomopsis amygdali TaxID=1214568 RepID=UPI0022FEDCFA|nr:uncharacterized protein J7T55_006666 [Diaporthe amygdali]KAJ0125320.1 hypothetical protein J7T55_006666 [Diaporthe amygdali]
MEATLSHILQSLKGTQGAAVAVALSVGLLILTVLQHAGKPRQSISTSVPLKVEALYFYPVKGLRGCELKEGKIGPLGFEHDRTFCLQKIHRDPQTNEIKRYEPMFSGFHLRMALFLTRLEDSANGSGRDIVVTWTGPENPKNDKQIRFPLRPHLGILKKVHLDLYGATTDAFDMGDSISAWFSSYLGFETHLMYLGQNSRPVLGSGAPNSELAFRKRLSPLAYSIRRLLVPAVLRPKSERISFADMGQYLVVTKESNSEVGRRLRETDPSAGDVEMDITKFRPNIVVSGSPTPFDEEYWAELRFPGETQMALTGNCLRCQSITVDYETGKPAADVRGQAWKKLSKDRRVDKGCTFMPVFGRYGYSPASNIGRDIRVGDQAVLTRRNRDRTVFGESNACFKQEHIES